MHNALKGIDYLYRHPEKRAEDWMEACADKPIVNYQLSIAPSPFSLPSRIPLCNIRNTLCRNHVTTPHVTWAKKNMTSQTKM